MQISICFLGDVLASSFVADTVFARLYLILIYLKTVREHTFIVSKINIYVIESKFRDDDFMAFN